MKQRARVSVIVPVHNGERELPELIAALKGLEYPPELFEVILVDNRSTDRTAEIIKASGFIFESETERQSSYAARNRGLQRAAGEVIAFTDADCRPDPAWLREGVAALETGADLAAGRVEMTAGPNPNLYEIYSRGHELKQENCVRAGFAVTANLIVKREVFASGLSFNPRLISGGDREFTRAAVEKGYKLIYAENCLVRHRARSSMKSLLAKERRVSYGLAQLKLLGWELPLAHREWRYYFPAFNPYREFTRGRELSVSDRVRAFFLLWAMKLSRVRGSFEAARDRKRKGEADGGH